VGIVLSTGGTITNTGTVTGGIGGYGQASGDAGAGPGGIKGLSGIGGAGGDGVVLNGGTLVTDGTVAGGAAGKGAGGDGAQGDAVYFGTLGGTIIAEAGAVFSGFVVGNSTSSVLELSGTSSSALALTNQFFGLSAVDFAANAQRTLALNVGLFPNNETFGGFAAGDGISLDGFTESSAVFSGHDLILNATGGYNVTLDLAGSFTTADFSFVDSGGNTTIFSNVPPACFVTGTRILTPSGEIPVEDIAPGDAVLTMRDGAARRVIWVGRRTIDLRRHADAAQVNPVRIRAGAFADGLPVRDLLVSPDHALFIGDHLIDARLLVDDITIIHETGRQFITYHHLEFDRHDIILAEGLPTESYLDTGNRHMFENQPLPIALHPNFAARGAHDGCAPRVSRGAVLATAQAALQQRAAGFTATLAAALS
jgi:hypothetical protein